MGLDDLLIPAGGLLVAAGAWQFHPGAGLIVGGALLLAFGWLFGLPKKRKGGG